MKRPYKYYILCLKTNRIVSEQNREPLLHEVLTWEPTEGENVCKLTKTKKAYIDTRYAAKLRMFNYVNYTRKGLPVPRYQPYKNTKIGKTKPILN